MPSANRLTVGIMAMVAEEEGRAISKRTKKALAAAKRRGTVLGGYRGAKITRRIREAGNDAQKRLAKRRAVDLLPIIKELKGGRRYVIEVADAQHSDCTRRQVATHAGYARAGKTINFTSIFGRVIQRGFPNRR